MVDIWRVQESMEAASAPLTDWIGWLHFLGAILALSVGLVVIFIGKGTTLHRVLGAVYAVLMLALNTAALSLHREDVFGPFHVLAVMSLTTIVVGIGLLLFTERPPHLIAVHAYLMSWSYVGLVAAGTGQLTVTFKINGGLATWLVIVVTLLVGGVIIHTRIPRTLRAVLGSGNRAVV